MSLDVSNCTCGTCVTPCDGACVSLKAVSVNIGSIAPQNCINARPGDTITAEIRISGWGEELPLGVRAYEAMIDGTMGATSGMSGMIFPLGWDAPPHPNSCLH